MDGKCAKMLVCALVLTACIMIVAAEAACKQTFNMKGSFELPNNLTAGQNCTWTLGRVNPKSYTNGMVVHLQDLSIQKGDSLIVNDETAPVVNMSEKSVISQVVVILGKTATIVFTVGEKGTKSRGKVDVNPTECKAQMTNTLALKVSTPTFLINITDFNCTYVVTNNLPVDRMAVVSFVDFGMDNTSFVKLTSGKKNETYKGGSQARPDDFFTDPSNTSVTVDFLLKKSAKEQPAFSLAFDTFVQSCTRELDVSNETVEVSTSLPSDPGVAYGCRWKVTKVGTGAAILAHVIDLNLTSDSLTLVAGGSSLGQPLAQFRKSVSKDYIVLSSQPSMLATLDLSSTIADDRALNITFQRLDDGGHFTGSGKLVAGKSSSLTTADSPALLTAYYQLVASAGQQVKLDVKTPLPVNASLTLYKGLQPSDGILITLDSDAASLSLQSVVGQASMLVVLENFPASDNFTALFTSVPAGCDQLVTDTQGQLSFSSPKPAAGQTDSASVCTWTIVPTDDSIVGGVTVLNFNRLTLDNNTTIKVYSKSPQVIASFKGPVTTSPLPQVNVPQGTPVRVSIYQSNKQSKDMVTLSYKLGQQVCGGPLSAKGTLSTPNHPNQYPLNAQCDWTTAQQKDPNLLFLSFTQLDLSQKHSLSVVDVKNGTTNVLAQYMGSANSTAFLPNDLIVPATNSSSVLFSSVPKSAKATNAVGTGAVVNFWQLECGGNLTTPNGSLASPAYPKPSPAPTTCVWILSLPPLSNGDSEGNDASGDSQSIRFTVTAKGKQVKDIAKYLKIYDGPSLRYPLNPANASNGTSGSVLSRYSTLTVLYDLGQGVKDEVAFNLTYSTYVCNASTQCANGICMHPDWVCNYKDDCGDGTDEQHCVFPHPTPAPPAPPQDYSGWVRTAWVPACLFIGIALGAALLLIIPRIIKRFRGGTINYNRMGDDRPVVA